MNLLLSSHSENRMRIHLKFNAEKLGECVNKFQQEPKNLKEKVTVKITVFFTKVAQFHSFLSSHQLRGKLTKINLSIHTNRQHTFLALVFDLIMLSKIKICNLVSMKKY